MFLLSNILACLPKTKPYFIQTVYMVIYTFNEMPSTSFFLSVYSEKRKRAETM